MTSDVHQTELVKEIKKLLDSERLSVLSTQNNGQPYASLVAFAATPDLKHLLFLTPSTTRKYNNLTVSPRVAMLVTNSRNLADDIEQAVSLTIIGSAKTVENERMPERLALLLGRHPNLKAFSALPTTRLVSVRVDKYIMVNRFQNVEELSVTS